MIQFHNQTTRSFFNKTMKELKGKAQTKFAHAVKEIADKKIVSDSDDFTVTLSDLRVALSK